jgi:hypothetical protein
MRRLCSWILALPIFGLFACSSDPANGPTYYGTVKALVERKCNGCHGEGGIAPYPLASYDDLVQHQEAIRTMVSTRQMPPWPPDDGCNQYLSDRSLSDSEIATLVSFLDTGLAQGDRSAYKAPPPPPAALSRVDKTLTMPVAYTPQITPDDYRCFVIDWPYQTTKYVTGFRALPGTPEIVHHVIGFLATPNQVSEYEALDAADPAPGYTCFGGPGGSSLSVAWVGAWAPGSQGSDYPAGTGLRIEPGSKVILQVHYNTLNNAAAVDQTSIEVKVDDAVEKEALIVPFTDVDWVLRRTMKIAAGDPDAHYSVAADVTSWLGFFDPRFQAGRPFTVYGAGLHQHLRGTHSRLSVERASGASQCLLDIPRWDFHWQGMYGLVAPTVVNPGDQISLECHWDNSAGNQPVVNGRAVPPTDLNWGEGSTDEMCLGLMYVTQ